MMNIFIMILVALFMAGYYLLDSPSQNIVTQTTEYAIVQSDLRTIAQCVAAVQNSNINGTDFQDICIQQNQIILNCLTIHQYAPRVPTYRHRQT